MRSSGIDRMLNVCETYGLDFWIGSDRAKVTPGLRFEARIFEVSGRPLRGNVVRVVGHGATAHEAATKAHHALVALRPEDDA